MPVAALLGCPAGEGAGDAIDDAAPEPLLALFATGSQGGCACCPVSWAGGLGLFGPVGVFGSVCARAVPSVRVIIDKARTKDFMRRSTTAGHGCGAIPAQKQGCSTIADGRGVGFPRPQRVRRVVIPRFGRGDNRAVNPAPFAFSSVTKAAS